MRPHAVLFDCDGVIVDSESTAFDLLAGDFARLGHEMSRSEMETRFIGGTIHGLWERARGLGVPLPEGWDDDFYESLYARLAEGTALIEGIEAVFDRLDAEGIPYAVGSNGSDHKMQVTLGQHPALLAKLHGRLFSGQTLGAPKPAPDLYLHAARALGVPPAHAAVIEDSPTGARAARAAGMTCFGYAPHGQASALRAEGAIPFTDMRDLPGLLGL